MTEPLATDQPVCVTGASGFVAAHLVRELLARGYRVRGTVRRTDDLSKYTFLTSLPGADERLELVAAELLTAGSYAAAVAGCEVVFHTASPYAVNVEDPQADLVDPAVKGTVNVLDACKAAGTRRVIVTSSMAAISDEPDNERVFSEKDWNDKSSLVRNPYYYSKVLAERAAWDYVKGDDKPFELITINPFLVIGPSLGPSLNTSNGMLRDIIKGVYPAILDLSWGFVDVRDVATAHVRAMENPEASGRYLVAGETLSMTDLVLHLREIGAGRDGGKLPRMRLTGGFGTRLMRAASYTQPRGTATYLRSHLGKVMRYTAGKSERELGMAYMPARDSVTEAIADMRTWGHL